MWIIPLLTIETLVEDFNYHCQHVDSHSVCHHFRSFIRWFQNLEDSFKYYCFTYYTTNQVFIIFNIFANFSSFLNHASITMSVCLDIVGTSCINICVVLMLVSLTDSIDSAYQTVLKQKEQLQNRFFGSVQNMQLYAIKGLNLQWARTQLLGTSWCTCCTAPTRCARSAPVVSSTWRGARWPAC